MTDVYKKGLFRIVELKDFPDGDQFFDRIDTLDTLVAFQWTSQLEVPCMRYVDLVVWKRPNVLLTDDALDELLALWDEEITSTAGHNEAAYILNQEGNSLDPAKPLPKLVSIPVTFESK